GTEGAIYTQLVRRGNLRANTRTTGRRRRDLRPAARLALGSARSADAGDPASHPVQRDTAGQPLRHEDQHERHERRDDDGAGAGPDVQPADSARLRVSQEQVDHAVAFVSAVCRNNSIPVPRSAPTTAPRSLGDPPTTSIARVRNV